MQEKYMFYCILLPRSDAFALHLHYICGEEVKYGSTA